MKRASLELAILLGLMLVGGTAYTLAIRGNAETALPWVSPVLPRGWPQLPPAAVADSGSDGTRAVGEGADGNGGSEGASAQPRAIQDTEPPPASDPSAASTEGGAGDPADEPEGPFRFIDHEETLGHYEDGVAVFIDARRTREYVAGHIQGARSISYWEADADEKIGALREEVPLEIPIIVYCTRSKDCEDSQFLAQKLHDVGFLDLMVYRGGFPEWKEKEPTRVVTGREPGEK